MVLHRGVARKFCVDLWTLPYGLSRRYAKISIAKPDTSKYLVLSGQLALSIRSFALPRTFDRFDHDLEEKTCSLLLRFIYFCQSRAKSWKYGRNRRASSVFIVENESARMHTYTRTRRTNRSTLLKLTPSLSLKIHRFQFYPPEWNVVFETTQVSRYSRDFCSSKCDHDHDSFGSEIR